MGHGGGGGGAGRKKKNKGAPRPPAGTQPALSRRPVGAHTQGALRRTPGAQGLCPGAQQQAPSRRYSAQGALRRPSGAQELCSALQALSCGRLVGGAALKGRSGARQAIRGCAALRGHSGVLMRPASAQGLCCAQWGRVGKGRVRVHRGKGARD